MSMTEETAQQVAEYVETTDALINEMTQKNAALEAQVAELQTQKTASIATTVFDKEAASAAVDQLVHRGLLKPSEHAATLDKLMSDPASALDYIEKMATSLPVQKAASSLGQGVSDSSAPSAADGVRESDKHWDSHFGALHSRLR